MMRIVTENNSLKQYKGLVAYFRSIIELRTKERKNFFNYDISLKHLEKFTSGEIAFSQISPEWVKRLNEYLKTTTSLRGHKTLSINSAGTYFKVIMSVIKNAADDRLIDHKVVNAIQVVSPRTKADLNYLTVEELNSFASAKCKDPMLKNAFLFSCLTGLGWREINALKWYNIDSIEGTQHVNITSNDVNICVPLNDQSFSFLGRRSKEDDKIFKLHYSGALCSNLNKWAIRAGVYRQITFSTAKQTFAMTLLSQGVPIELISELLGHKHLKSTMKLLNYERPTQNYLRAFII